MSDLETMTALAMTGRQMMVLSDLVEAPVWLLTRGDHRPMKRLIELGFAEHIGGEWKITPAGKRAWKAISAGDTSNANA